MKLGTSSAKTGGKPGVGRILFLALLLGFLLPSAARAQVQFDVFVGYGDLGGGGGVVPEASWFPVVCEIKNNGPTFNGVIEINAGNYGQSQNERYAVELPTGTLKRISIPVFNAGRYARGWDFRLLDEKGRLRAERPGAGARSVVASGTTLMGALPRTSGGAPTIRQVLAQSQDYQPVVARFVEAAIIPDNPLLWEAMDTFYLNSEKAPNLSEGQVEALQAWLNNGGHLIVAVESVSDVNGTPWLRSLVPMDLNGTRAVKEHRGLQQWLRAPYSAPNNGATARLRSPNSSGNFYASPFANLNDDQDYEAAEITVATGTLRGGQATASADGAPLIVTARQGRGEVTVLLFDPERDPTRAWKNLPTFWAKMAKVPPDLYVNSSFNQRNGYGIDGVFGAMIDSKQIRKLPVEWLLLLLILYLAVIGPLDQYWLKRIKRPMLTWLTFPCYVVLFSLLIYLIGYKLRAGETEWNELHFVDVLPRGDGAEMRGRSYYSIYSPVNDTYRVASQLAFSTFRGEFQGSWSTGSPDEHADVLQAGDNYQASIFVPVWTSQLYASDWWQPADKPISASITSDGQNGWIVKVDNRQEKPLSHVRLALEGYIYDLTDVPAGESRTNRISSGRGQPLSGFVNGQSIYFQSASQQRQHSFGSSSAAQISDLPDSSMAISLLGAQGAQNGMNQNSFVMPPGLDVSPMLDRGEAVLLAWESDFAPVKPVNQFPTRRSHKDTLWRLALPLSSSNQQ